MKGIELKKYLLENKITVASVARLIGTTPQNLSSKLLAEDISTGLLESIAAAVGKDVPFFYGCDSSGCCASAAGECSTAVAGNQNNVNSERFVQLLTKKDEQIDRLLAVIETLSKSK